MSLPEVVYIEGIKNDKSEIREDFEFVLQLKNGVSFGEFIEAAVVLYTSNELVLHCTDVDWYEDGGYKTGILHAELFFRLEEYFRRKNLLKADENLQPICYYSVNSGRQDFIFLPPASRI